MPFGGVLGGNIEERHRPAGVGYIKNAQEFCMHDARWMHRQTVQAVVGSVRPSGRSCQRKRTPAEDPERTPAVIVGSKIRILISVSKKERSKRSTTILPSDETTTSDLKKDIIGIQTTEKLKVLFA